MTNTIVFLSLCALAVVLLIVLYKQYDKRQEAERENWRLKNQLDVIEFDLYRQFMNPDSREFTAGWNSALDAKASIPAGITKRQSWSKHRWR